MKKKVITGQILWMYMKFRHLVWKRFAGSADSDSINILSRETRVIIGFFSNKKLQDWFEILKAIVERCIGNMSCTTILIKHCETCHATVLCLHMRRIVIPCWIFRRDQAFNDIIHGLVAQLIWVELRECILKLPCGSTIDWKNVKIEKDYFIVMKRVVVE